MKGKGNPIKGSQCSMKGSTVGLGTGTGRVGMILTKQPKKGKK
jgi:hypothetical protein